MKKIAVLIPCYNEACTIAKVVSDYKRILPNADIYVYNNNSTDDSDKIAVSSGAIVVNEYQQGKGFVIRSMFRDIEADCYIMVDSDNTYEAADAVVLSEYILNGKADMAIGDRLSGSYFIENKRMFHNIGNRFVRFLINHIFHNKIKDIMTGCRAFSRRFVKTFPVLSQGFEIETEMTIHALDKRFSLVEKQIEYRDRPKGSVSKLKTIKDGIKVIKTIFLLYKNYRPLNFFGLISIILTIISLAVFIPILIEYFRTGLVLKMPSLLFSIGTEIIALLSLVCGIILDTIKKYNDFLYELFVNLFNERNK